MRHVHCANWEGHFKLVFGFYFVPLLFLFLFLVSDFRTILVVRLCVCLSVPILDYASGLQFCSLARELRCAECFCYDNYATHLRNVSEAKLIGAVQHKESRITMLSTGSRAEHSSARTLTHASFDLASAMRHDVPITAYSNTHIHIHA